MAYASLLRAAAAVADKFRNSSVVLIVVMMSFRSAQPTRDWWLARTGASQNMTSCMRAIASIEERRSRRNTSKSHMWMTRLIKSAVILRVVGTKKPTIMQTCLRLLNFPLIHRVIEVDNFDHVVNNMTKYAANLHWRISLLCYNILRVLRL